MISKEIKDFIITRFSSTSDFDDLCRVLQIKNIFTGSYDNQATGLIRKLESDRPGDEAVGMLYNAFITLKPYLVDEINELFKIENSQPYNGEFTYIGDTVQKRYDMKQSKKSKDGSALTKKSTFSWLHFSDLHWGTGEIKDRWSRVEKALFRDIAYLKDTHGLAFDVIFFSGDLVSRGKEYDDLNEWLTDLKDELAGTGPAPLFFAVPGNHDLERPGDNDDSYLVVRDRWEQDETIRNRIWQQDADSGTWKLFQSVFKNYTGWWKDISRSFPRPRGIKDGLLPGDFSYTVEKNSHKIGIIGLNIAFLHLSDGACGRLDIHPAQLTALCGRRHDKWIDSHDICFLLTHHPVSWLSGRGKEEYMREIAPAGRFLLHFCGHLHESSYEEMKQGFKTRERRTFIGTSLFSVERYMYQQGDDSREMVDRRHGYSAGQVCFDSRGTTITIWPRTVNNNGTFVVNTDLCPRGEYAENSVTNFTH